MASFTMSIFMAEPQKIAQLAAEAILIGFPYGEANTIVNEIVKQLKTPGSQINNTFLKLMNRADTTNKLVTAVADTIEESFPGNRVLESQYLIAELDEGGPLLNLLCDKINEKACVVIEKLRIAIERNFSRGTVEYLVKEIREGSICNSFKRLLYDLQ